MTVVHRDKVPVLQNVILRDVSDARSFPAHELRYLFCERCGFIWNAAFDEGRIVYDDNYNNDVQSSPYYVEHQRQMARRVLSSLPGTGAGYVEVGCGGGEFIRNMLSIGRDQIETIVGFDPAYQSQLELNHRVTIHKQYFELPHANLFPEHTHAIVSRHTIEHIPNPRTFIASIAGASRSRGAAVFLETPDVRWILRNVAFEDWFYEHCSLFSPPSMGRLLADYGLRSETSDVYDGQYMWTEAHPGAARDTESQVEEMADLVRVYRSASEALIGEWRERLAVLRRAGPVAIWGAASKGVTFSLLMNEGDTPLVDAAIDLNPKKQGCFLPITGVPIMSPETARRKSVGHIVVMNPNYLDEIEDLAGAMGWSATVISLRNSGGQSSGTSRA